MGPSWADLPLTVKVTPLGALDLTSRLAWRYISLVIGETAFDQHNEPELAW